MKDCFSSGHYLKCCHVLYLLSLYPLMCKSDSGAIFKACFYILFISQLWLLSPVKIHLICMSQTTIFSHEIIFGNKCFFNAANMQGDGAYFARCNSKSRIDTSNHEWCMEYILLCTVYTYKLRKNITQMKRICS